MRDFLTELYFAASPMLLDLLDVVLVILLARISAIATKRWGIEIEAKHREALQTAIMSGIRAAIGRGEGGSVAVQSALSHAMRSVPDAIAALRPAGGVLTSIAEAKLREAAEAQPIYSLGPAIALPLETAVQS